MNFMNNDQSQSTVEKQLIYTTEVPNVYSPHQWFFEKV